MRKTMDEAQRQRKQPARVAQDAAARAVDPSRLWQRYRRLMPPGILGGMVRGGAPAPAVPGTDGSPCRLAFSVEDLAARALIVNWAEDRHFDVFIDEVANLYVRLSGWDQQAAPIVIGGHIDTPGAPSAAECAEAALGCVLAMEVLEALAESSAPLKHPVELAILSNFHGERFQPSTLGASIRTGQLPLSDVAGVVDDDGRSLHYALERVFEAFGSAMPRSTHEQIGAFIEVIVETGIETTLGTNNPGYALAQRSDAMLTLDLAVTAQPYRITDRTVFSGQGVPANDAVLCAGALLGRLAGAVAGEDQCWLSVGALRADPVELRQRPAHLRVQAHLFGPELARLKSLAKAAESWAQVNSGSFLSAKISPGFERSAIAYDPALQTILKCASSGSVAPELQGYTGRMTDAAVFRTGGVPSALVMVDGCHCAVTPGTTAQDLRRMQRQMTRLARDLVRGVIGMDAVTIAQARPVS